MRTFTGASTQHEFKFTQTSFDWYGNDVLEKTKRFIGDESVRFNNTSVKRTNHSMKTILFTFSSQINNIDDGMVRMLLSLNPS